MSSAKIPLLIGASFCVHRSITAPNPPPPVEETSKYRDLWPRSYMVWGTGLSKVAMYTHSFLEVLAIVCVNTSTSPHASTEVKALAQRALSLLCAIPARSERSASALQITPSFLLGFVLVALSAYIRTLCYRTLGRLFTFELSIQPKHKLVTSGPYSIVRHPSYTGSILGFAGSLVCAFCAGGWFCECGWLDTAAGKLFVVAYVLWNVQFASVMLWRTGQEDQMMHGRFGKEWEGWREKVRYRIIPGIF